MWIVGQDIIAEMRRFADSIRRLADSLRSFLPLKTWAGFVIPPYTYPTALSQRGDTLVRWCTVVLWVHPFAWRWALF